MGLTERIERNVDLSYFEGRIPVNYLYTYGLGFEKFFRALKEEGKLLASKCPRCGTTYFPCRVFCEQCFCEIEGTLGVSGEGTLYSYSVCHLNMDGSPKKTPEVVGLIEMDGTDGAKFVHLIDAQPEEIQIGMRLKPVLKPKKERNGDIFDIKGFKKA
ncbi:MAG: Zn-ribbon domain-containing OB-fold protein [Actinomycetota bacterium]|nr:Zn-ribbon domain-containing OB-fold protein [Actinomycetota bacterium]